jgi:hypothetical protein
MKKLCCVMNHDCQLQSIESSNFKVTLQISLLLYGYALITKTLF